MTPDLQGEERMMLMWGDDRPGRDALFVRQTGTRLEVLVSDTAANTAQAIVATLDASMGGRWIPLVFRHNAKNEEISLHPSLVQPLQPSRKGRSHAPGRT